MNSLTEEQKYEVRKEIESVLRKKTREVLDEVEKKCPFANRHQISGVLSGMNTNNYALIQSACRDFRRYNFDTL
jgi:hypothetical protein